MTGSWLIFGLPLLTKDLIEQAAHRRTFVLRVVYAIVLYGSALWIYADVVGGGASGGISNLGRGRELFAMLVKVQLGAIIVLLPGISCGAITAEKERDTLGLLLLTQLSPLTIVLEKLISRLVTMGTYQLLSLPLFALAYGLGGVELFEIIAVVWILAWWSVVVGSLSLCCSAWHRTTAGAFIAAYSLMPLVICFAASCIGMINPAMHEVWNSQNNMSWIQFLAAAGGTFVLLLVIAVPLLLVSGVAVTIAQSQLLARAFVPHRNYLLEFFKKLDSFFEELNNQTTRGVLLVRESDTGPMFEPIAWRETRKRSLGTVRYLFRLLVVLQVPLAVAIVWTISDNQRNSFDGPTAFFLSLLWPISILAVIVHTTSVLSAERSRQTLDVLLVTPLSARELVSQKLAGVRRLMGVLSVPFLTLLVFQGIWTLYVIGNLNTFVSGADGLAAKSALWTIFLHEILGMGIALIVYPPLVQWLSFHLSLRMKNQTQAVLTSLVAVIALCGLPYMVVYLLAIMLRIDPRDSSIEWITWLSPVRVLFHRQVINRESGLAGRWSPPAMSGLGDPTYVGIGMHAAAYVVLWFFLRARALSDFSRWVGRSEPPKGTR